MSVIHGTECVYQTVCKTYYTVISETQQVCGISRNCLLLYESHGGGGIYFICNIIRELFAAERNQQIVHWHGQNCS